MPSKNGRGDRMLWKVYFRQRQRCECHQGVGELIVFCGYTTDMACSALLLVTFSACAICLRLFQMGDCSCILVYCFFFCLVICLVNDQECGALAPWTRWKASNGSLGTSQAQAPLSVPSSSFSTRWNSQAQAFSPAPFQLGLVPSQLEFFGISEMPSTPSCLRVICNWYTGQRCFRMVAFLLGQTTIRGGFVAAELISFSMQPPVSCLGPEALGPPAGGPGININATGISEMPSTLSLTP